MYSVSFWCCKTGKLLFWVMSFICWELSGCIVVIGLIIWSIVWIFSMLRRDRDHWGRLRKGILGFCFLILLNGIRLILIPITNWVSSNLALNLLLVRLDRLFWRIGSGIPRSLVFSTSRLQPWEIGREELTVFILFVTVVLRYLSFSLLNHRWRSSRRWW